MMIHRRYKRLAEVTPDFETSGIFYALTTLEAPWAGTVSAVLLDTEYYGNRSGERIISPLVNRKLVDGVLPAAAIRSLAGILIALYGENWEREYATLSAQYDPISNYDMIEQLTGDTTTDQFGHVLTRNNNLSRKKTGTETLAPTTTFSSSDSVYGFNSTDASPSESHTESSGGTSTTTYNTTDADTGTVTDTESGSNSKTRSYTLTRTGNIGVTTSQQMLQSERDLWVWNFFEEIVFPSVDTILTIPIW